MLVVAAAVSAVVAPPLLLLLLPLFLVVLKRGAAGASRAVRTTWAGVVTVPALRFTVRHPNGQTVSCLLPGKIIGNGRVRRFVDTVLRGLALLTVVTTASFLFALVGPGR